MIKATQDQAKAIQSYSRYIVDCAFYEDHILKLALEKQPQTSIDHWIGEARHCAGLVLDYADMLGIRHLVPSFIMERHNGTDEA